MKMSLFVTDVAWILIRTSSSFGTGLACSTIFSTSAGPYLVHTMAFIVSMGAPSSGDAA